MAKMGRSSAVVRLISSSREHCGHTHQPADPAPLWVTPEEPMGPRETPPATWGVLSWGPAAYLRHEGDLERASHLPLEGSHLLQEGALPEPGLGQPGVARRVVVEGEGQDQGLGR